MSRFVLFILLNYIFISQIKFGFSQNNNTTTACDCHYDLQIDVVKKVMKDLEEVRKSTDKISNIEKQLLANRATNPASCMEAAANSFKSGIYRIKLENINVTELEVFCEESLDFGGWLVIQRRQSGSVNFTRDWHDYKEGFGDLTGNFWIGLEKLHALTSSCEQELYIQLQKRNGKKYFAKYAEFLIGAESESYALKKLGNYNGNAGDSLSSKLGYKFSTYDRDNDSEDLWNCAEYLEGGWWFNGCDDSNLNGVYGDNDYGVHWVRLEKDKSLSFAQMMIRPTQNCWRRLMLSKFNRCE